MKLRSFFSFLIVSIIALLAVGAGAFYWLKDPTPLNLLQGGSTRVPAATIFIPKNAPMMLSILENPDKLEALGQKFAPAQEKGKIHSEFNQIKKSFLVNSGLNYSRDIQPWIGNEVTLAIAENDFDYDSSNGQQIGLLLAVESDNIERSRECIERFWQKSVTGKELVSVQYKGVKLMYRQKQIDRNITPLFSEISPTLATAIVPSGSTNQHSFVLFANHPKVLREAINNVQAANLNLSNNYQYQQALQQLKNGRIAVAFVNLSELNQTIGGQKEIGRQVKESLKNSTTNLAFTIGVKPLGLLAESILLLPEGQDLPLPLVMLESAPIKALNYIPAASPFVAASVDLNHLWDRISAKVAGNNFLSKLLNQPIADLQVNWGIDLVKDIFKSVHGEYVLALLPHPDRALPDWIFVAEKSPDLTKAIAHLDEIAASQNYSIGNFSLDNQQISAWTKLTTSTNFNRQVIKAEARGVRATVGNYEVFTSSVEAMDAVLKASELGSLAGNSEFQNAIAFLPQLNNGYLYLDWQSSREIWERGIPFLRLIELSGKPFFDHWRSLTLTSTGGDAGIQRASMFIRLN
ncbi:hypothetical protein BCD67_10180 [Oscillatoriales cyanobacterium USR001]|nr:hypothetical protein BCD67_10180 [Oscillatoriales cyanobacterium USR001]